MCSISVSADTEAFEELTEVAEQGFAHAQFNVGNMYYRGEGVPQNYKQAFRWFTKAAWKGHGKAQASLGVMYNSGDGVLQDYAKAHMWYNIAGANGYEFGGKNRDALAKEMTSDQLAEAQRMAREMVEANPKLMGE